MEDETKGIKSKSAMTKSFISKNKESKGYTKRLVLSSIHKYIHISILKPQSGDCLKTQSYHGTLTSHGDKLKI